MSLSEQQERFCQLIAQGKNQTDAYVEAGYKCKSPDVAKANASRLIANANVSARIANLRAMAAEATQIDLQWLIKKGVDLLLAAEKEGAYGPAISALKEVGILTGYRVEQRKNENVNRYVDELTDDELTAIIKAGSGAYDTAEAGRSSRAH